MQLPHPCADPLPSGPTGTAAVADQASRGRQEMTKTPKTAEYTSPSGKTIVGDVVKANGSTVYVKWRSSGRVEPVSRKDATVIFKY